MWELVHLRGSCALPGRGAPGKLFCSATLGIVHESFGGRLAIVSSGPNLIAAGLESTMKYDMDLTLNAGCGHAFDKLLLEDEEDYNQRDNV